MTSDRRALFHFDILLTAPVTDSTVYLRVPAQWMMKGTASNIHMVPLLFDIVHGRVSFQFHCLHFYYLMSRSGEWRRR